MLYQKYKFSILFEENAHLPEYKGSTIRGILGIALKRLVCVFQTADCDICALKQNCVYTNIFEKHLTNEDSSQTPHPYVIEPPDTKQKYYKKGESLNFSLILFGYANGLIPHFIYSITNMENIGIGKKIQGKRAFFLLDKVIIEKNNLIIYDKDIKKIKNNVAEDITFAPLSSANNLKIIKEITITINFNTPLSFKINNTFMKKTNLPFHILIKIALRRISSLYRIYDEKTLQIDYLDLINKAKKVIIKKSNLSILYLQRYSNRQKTKMSMGGVVGDIIYQGDLSCFIPILKLCELFHIGKQTTFGLGKIKIFEKK